MACLPELVLASVTLPGRPRLVSHFTLNWLELEILVTKQIPLGGSVRSVSALGLARVSVQISGWRVDKRLGKAQNRVHRVVELEGLVLVVQELLLLEFVEEV